MQKAMLSRERSSTGSNDFFVVVLIVLHPLVIIWLVHLLDEGVSSLEDASTSWPSSSGLRGRRRTFPYHF
jgi:hypothetical protein